MSRRLGGAGRSGALAWAAVGAVLALPALAAWATRGLSGTVLSWQPALAGSQVWRWWSAAWVHLDARHLAANLAGALLVVLLGQAARVPRAAAWAWAAAWPLTHLSLWLQPELLRYGGLSGVLHAGVAVVAMHLLWVREPQAATGLQAGPLPGVAQVRHAWRGPRGIGAALALGLVAKVLLEAPWQGALRRTPEWDFAVAPLAHAAGAFWGALLGLWAAHSLARRAAREAMSVGGREGGR